MLGPKAKLDWVLRVLSRSGALSLSDAKAAIAQGRVRVCGRTVRQPFAAVRPSDEVLLDGVAVPKVATTRALAFHKPKGTVTSKVAARGEETVFQRLFRVLPQTLASFEWHAVGRLDKDTTGLLLFTNHEKFVAHVTSPKTHLPKVYRVRVSGALTQERLRPLQEGLELQGARLRPVRAHVLDPHELELTLTEGKNHQVKRMLGAVGYPVLALARVRVGEIALDVKEGQVRELSAEEIRFGLKFEGGPDE
jgi:23S rRNA pseudouridine2605 synthase/16S rRNA pseudouridine516 synthase